MLRSQTLASKFAHLHYKTNALFSQVFCETDELSAARSY